MVEALGSAVAVLVLLLALEQRLLQAAPMLVVEFNAGLQSRLDERAEGRPAAPLKIVEGQTPAVQEAVGRPPPSRDGTSREPPRWPLVHHLPKAVTGASGYLGPPVNLARLVLRPPDIAALYGLEPFGPGRDPPNNNLVIVIGGYDSEADGAELKKAVLNLGYPPEDVIVFSYRRFECDSTTGHFIAFEYAKAETRETDLALQGQRLREALRTCYGITGRHVDLIAHSQGGVVAMEALVRDADPCHAGFDHIVTIDSPLQGFPELAAHGDVAEWFGHRSLAQMGSESPFMEAQRGAIARGAVGCGVSLTTLSGVNDTIVSSTYSYFPNHQAEDPEQVRNHFLIAGPRHQLTGKLDLLFHGTNQDSPEALASMHLALSDSEGPPSSWVARVWHASNQVVDLLPFPGRPSPVSMLRLFGGLSVSFYALRQFWRARSRFAAE